MEETVEDLCRGVVQRAHEVSWAAFLLGRDDARVRLQRERAQTWERAQAAQ
jgi:hypothetical protein